MFRQIGVAIFLALGAALYKLLSQPEQYVKLVGTTEHFRLLEGSVFSSFLADHTKWRHFDGDVSTENLVDSIDDIPENNGPPLRYRLSQAAMRDACPYVENEFYGPAATDIPKRFFSSTPMAVKHNDIALESGYNAVGCASFSYENGSTVVNEIEAGIDHSRYALSFDGFIHEKINDEDSRAMKNLKVSNFYSNFSAPVFTAPLHASMTSSTVVMCAGVKTWFFLKPDCCNDFGHLAHAGATIGTGFSRDAEITVVQTRPGDVVTFGSYQHHMVLTDPNPTFMQTYRHFHLGTLKAGIINYGMTYLKSLRDARRRNKGGKNTADQAAADSNREYCQNHLSGVALEKILHRIEAHNETGVM